MTNVSSGGQPLSYKLKDKHAAFGSPLQINLAKTLAKYVSKTVILHRKLQYDCSCLLLLVQCLKKDGLQYLSIL